MNFATAIKTCFQKYTTFSGRASRSEYWFFVLFYVIGSLVMGILDQAIFEGSGKTGPLGAIFAIISLLPWIGVSVRRMHDINRSGWWALLPPGATIVLAVVVAMASKASNGAVGGGVLVGVMAIGIIAIHVVYIVWLCKKGTVGENRFGSDPLQ